MIEYPLLKTLDVNPLLIKSLANYLDSIPLIEYILYKYWGRIVVIKKKRELVLDHKWHEFQPQQPSQEILEFLRSC